MINLSQGLPCADITTVYNTHMVGNEESMLGNLTLMHFL